MSRAGTSSSNRFADGRPERFAADHAEVLARHFSPGDERAKALEYLTIAGDRAAAVFADREAAALVERRPAADRRGRPRAAGRHVSTSWPWRPSTTIWTPPFATASRYSSSTNVSATAETRSPCTLTSTPRTWPGGCGQKRIALREAPARVRISKQIARKDPKPTPSCARIPTRPYSAHGESNGRGWAALHGV